jgi:hypothetical protein
MTNRIPIALTVSDLPVAELAAARLDGELFGLAGSWCPVDALDGPETRAGALSRMAPHRAVAERLTAAWIYGLTPEPGEHQFCVDVQARTNKPPVTGSRLREVRLDGADTVLLGRLPVTTPLRTAVDLARWGTGWGTGPATRADTALIAALLHRDGRTDAVRVMLAGRSGASFSRLARQQLHTAIGRLDRGSAVADPVHVVHGVNAPHGVQYPVEVRGVTHLEDEPADRQPVTGGVHRRGEDVHVVLREHPGHVGQKARPVQRFDLDLYQEEAL